MYNTETAELIGRSMTGSGSSRAVEKLYKTRRGDHFIHGKGGELSRWDGGENIIEVDDSQVRNWLKRRGVIA